MCVFVNDVWASVRESTCKSVCLGTHIHVNVGVCEWRWMDLGECTCESVCVGANIHVNVGVWGRGWTDVCKYTRECVCVGKDVRRMCANLHVNLCVRVQIYM